MNEQSDALSCPIFAICPECGAKIEIKEHPEIPMFSEEEKTINKAIMSVRFWTNLNEIIIVTIGILMTLFLLLMDVSTKQGISPLILVLNSLIIISGLIFWAILENKAFKKLMRKKFPLAFY